MKFSMFYFIMIISISVYYCLRSKDNEFLLKMSETFYTKANITNNFNEFSNFYFKEIETNLKNPKHRIKNGSKEMKDHTHFGDFHISMGDYISSHRFLKLYINRNQDCSVLVNDTVQYIQLSKFNLIEHMILHNNAEVLEPKGVYSDEVSINFFAFDKKLNIFHVYFDNPLNYSNFSVEYDYSAINLIKTNSDKNYTNNNLFLGNKYNSFLWKIMNQNMASSLSEMIKIEIFFQLGKDFENFDLEFNLNFTKSKENMISKNSNDTIVKYSWEGIVKAQEVLILEGKFPLFFEQCGSIDLNYFLILMGATFIVFLIGMMHLILSTICFYEY